MLAPCTGIFNGFTFGTVLMSTIRKLPELATGVCACVVERATYGVPRSPFY